VANNQRRWSMASELLVVAGAILMAPSAEAQDLDGLKRAVAPAMALSDEEIIELIPDRAGIYFVGCPNCSGGTQENQISWTIERPQEVFCRFCDIRYPNDKYPDDQVLRVTNARGDEHEYPYWDDADGYHHFFQAKGWYVAREYFQDVARWLAELGGKSTLGDLGAKYGVSAERIRQIEKRAMEQMRVTATV